MPKLIPPENGVAVRMYRIGHGDCFLIAMPRAGGGDPVYVVIDCGYKPGSPGFIDGSSRPVDDIVKHLGESTGFEIDLFVVTHEHQDHLNGIWKKTDPYFKDFTIRRAWMAWTENPEDDLANELRRVHQDTLLSLVNARRRLALAVGEDDLSVHRVDSLLSLEFGGEDESMSEAAMLAAASDPEKSVNKQSLKLIRDKANQQGGVAYLDPGGLPLPVPDTDGILAYVLGPPRDAGLVADEDPRPGESFPEDHGFSASFRTAAKSKDDAGAPFSPRHRISMKAALAEEYPHPFFREHYGQDGESLRAQSVEVAQASQYSYGLEDREPEADAELDEAPSDAPWRRIDAEWLFSAEKLALKLNEGINNTSLVLAFELPRSKKVLLFAADAQRGNWISWSEAPWDATASPISTKDLLARTVLYKTGHHGSHNATLAGDLTSDYANLSWMATGSAAGEFTAMITAVNEWATTKNRPPWRHPLPSIRNALAAKAHGRVFQTDIAEPEQPDDVSDETWADFRKRSRFESLYFDYLVFDDLAGQRRALAAKKAKKKAVKATPKKAAKKLPKKRPARKAAR